MAARLVVQYNREELNSRLSSIINVENDDKLITHLKQILLFRDSGKISGNINVEYFTMWIQEQGRSGATGIFYPVITANIKSLAVGLEIKINSKMNIVGAAIAIAAFLVLAYLILTNIVIQENNELQYIIIRSCIAIVMLVLWMSLPIYLFIRTLRALRKHLVTELTIGN